MDNTQKLRVHKLLEQADAKVQQADDRFLALHASEACTLCNAGPAVPFSMAFQPIVDVSHGTVVAYEALARGPEGQDAATVLDHRLHNNLYSLDQRCREKAIALSAALGILQTSADLSVNFYPNAIYEPKQCLQRTLNAASIVGFSVDAHYFRDHRGREGPQPRTPA